MSQGSSHLDQDEQHRPSVDHCAAGGALPLAPFRASADGRLSAAPLRG